MIVSSMHYVCGDKLLYVTRPSFKGDLLLIPYIYTDHNLLQEIIFEDKHYEIREVQYCIDEESITVQLRELK